MIVKGGGKRGKQRDGGRASTGDEARRTRTSGNEDEDVQVRGRRAREDEIQDKGRARARDDGMDGTPRDQ
jgi:hypothetical protein